jgi:hypothetical protein
MSVLHSDLVHAYLSSAEQAHQDRSLVNLVEVFGENEAGTERRETVPDPDDTRPLTRDELEALGLVDRTAEPSA